MTSPRRVSRRPVTTQSASSDSLPVAEVAEHRACGPSMASVTVQSLSSLHPATSTSFPVPIIVQLERSRKDYSALVQPIYNTIQSEAKLEAVLRRGARGQLADC